MDGNGEIVSFPLRIIDDLFEQSLHGRTSILEADVAATSKIIRRFQDFATDTNNYRTIPSLDSRSIATRSLRSNQTVRYRGLIQDVFDIEYFVGVSTSDQTGHVGKTAYLKYRDVSEDPGIQEDGNGTVMERLPLYCIPLPGETDWCRDVGYIESGVDLAKANRKRQLNFADSDTVGNSRESADIEMPLKSHKIEDSKLDILTGPAISQRALAAINDIKVSKTKVADSFGVECLIKLYDFRQAGTIGEEDEDSPSLKLNDMIEVIGVFTAYEEPVDEATENRGGCNVMTMGMICGDPFSGFENCNNVRAKLINVHTIHCLVYKKLCSAYPLYFSLGVGKDALALCSRGNIFAKTSTVNPSIVHSTCYDALVQRISTALGGDDVSATYLALSIFSGVTGRAPGDVALGSLTVNIYGVEPTDPRIQLIFNALKEILPRVVKTRLDRDSLSLSDGGGYRYFAEKNSSTESIDRSCLQLGAGTVLLVDETRMTEGPITPDGVRSMKALESVVKSQILPVDFEYCPGIKIPLDICVVIISNAPSIIGENIVKSLSPSALFPVNNGKSINRDAEGMDLIGNTVPHQDLEMVRQWWAMCRMSNASLDEDMVRYVEEDFVSARQGVQHQPVASPGDIIPAYPVEASDFHNWLTLSRLVAIAQGSSLVTPVQWSVTRQLEAGRYQNKSRFDAQMNAVVQ